MSGHSEVATHPFLLLLGAISFVILLLLGFGLHATNDHGSDGHSQTSSTH